MYRYIALVILLVAGSGLITEALRRQQRERSLEDLTPDMQAEFDTLARLAHDPSPERRADAVDGLRAFGNLEALPILIGALRDPNKTVVIKSVGALEHFDYRIGAGGCASLLRLTRSADGEVRAAAERAAVQLCDWRAVPLILAELERTDCADRQFLFGLLRNCTCHVVPPAPEDQSAAQGELSEEQKQRSRDASLLQEWKEWFAKHKDSVPSDWLIEDLKNSGAEGRALAAEALGRLKETRAVKPLMKALKDEDEKACLKALEALTLMEAEDATPAISALYLASAGARANACEAALVRLALEKHIQTLASDLARADKGKARAYVRALEAASGRKMPDGADAAAYWSEFAAGAKGLAPLEMYARELKDKDPRNRFEAARRLKKSGEAAVPCLLDALEDEAPAVREEAAKSLKAVTFYYVEFKPEGTDEERRAAAGKWREWWKSKKGVKTAQRLINQLQDLRDARNRVEAAIGLKEIGAWEATPYLIDALSEESEALRYYSWCALESITAQSFEFVSNAQPEERSKMAMRWKAWWGGGKSDKETALIETIRSIAIGKSAKIRAIEALTRLNSRKSAAALVNLLDDKSFVIASVAEEALEQMTGKAFFYLPEQPGSGSGSMSATWREYLGVGKEA
jgi:HEAT repeat protein